MTKGKGKMRKVKEGEECKEDGKKLKKRGGKEKEITALDDKGKGQSEEGEGGRRIKRGWKEFEGKKEREKKE